MKSGDCMSIYKKLLSRTPSTSSVYFWNIAGSTTNALASMILLILVNRILGVEDGDIFSLAFSIGQVILTVATFQVRVYQATDVMEKFKFHHYFFLRVLSCAATVLVSAIYCMVNNYTGEKLMVVLLICLFRIIDAFSDVFQGMFQQKERLDLAGMSLTFRTLFSIVIFLLVMLRSKDLTISVAAFTLSAFLMVVLFDWGIFFVMQKKFSEISLQKWWQDLKAIKDLALKCLPLFINAYLIMTIYNEPKLSIDMYTTSGVLQSGTQTYYSILFMPAAVINLLFILFRPVITKMAFAFNENNFKKIYKTIFVVSLILIAFTVVAMLGAYLLGIPILSLLYGTGDSLYPYRAALLIIMLGGGFNAMANLFDNVVTVFRNQKYLLIAYLISFVTVKIIANPLVESQGIMGASYTFLISEVVLFFFILIIFVLSAIRKSPMKIRIPQ